jgi:hypothetical protein
MKDPAGPTSNIIRFTGQTTVIWVAPVRDGPGWLALAGSNGWLFGTRHDAMREAQWLARNFRLPIREVA